MDMGTLRRVVDRLTSVAADDVVSKASPRERFTTGMCLIGDTGDRERATVQGRITSLTLPTVTAAPALEAELADRTGPLQLIFTGRKAIPGIECGTVLRVSGRISRQGPLRVMYNPTYVIVPGREH